MKTSRTSLGVSMFVISIVIVVANLLCSSSGMNARGTFATEKIHVTGTGSDSIVAAGGMQMAGSAFVAGDANISGLGTIAAATTANCAGFSCDRLHLKSTAVAHPGSTMRWLNSVGALLWTIGNDTSDTAAQDFFIFDNVNARYLINATATGASYLRFGSTDGRFRYDDATHTWTLSTNAVTRLTIADALILFGTGISAQSSLNKGTIALNGGTPGTGTATVLAGAICTCSDSTAVAAVMCAVTATTLTATGGAVSSDNIAYVCM